MKKILSVIQLLAMMLPLCACGGADSTPDTATGGTNSDIPSPPSVLSMAAMR